VASAVCFTLRLHTSAAPPRGGLTQALAAINTLICPHCKKAPATGLHRFLPRTKLVRASFECNLCGEHSEFSSSAENWSIAAGTAGLVATLLTLRLVMSSLGTNQIPMSTLGAIVAFVVIIFIYQLPAALMLRHKATLLPLPPNGS
jgi:hypothetical protein